MLFNASVSNFVLLKKPKTNKKNNNSIFASAFKVKSFQIVKMFVPVAVESQNTDTKK